jgi:hypothetical protein
MRIRVGIGGLRLVQRFLCCGREYSVVEEEEELMGRYQASLPDELDLRPGMKLKVLRLYDDAWGTAQVVSGGLEGERTEGSFPIVRILFSPPVPAPSLQASLFQSTPIYSYLPHCFYCLNYSHLVSISLHLDLICTERHGN